MTFQKPKSVKSSWITVGQGDKNKPPVVRVPVTLPPFNMGSDKGARAIPGQSNK